MAKEEKPSLNDILDDLANADAFFIMSVKDGERENQREMTLYAEGHLHPHKLIAILMEQQQNIGEEIDAIRAEIRVQKKKLAN